jgi:hypothetical protein
MFRLTVLPVFLIAACLSAAQPPARLDGDRAFGHLRTIVAIGPRPAGSPGAARTRDYISSQLKALGLTVDEQAFEAATPLGPVKMVNLRAVIPGAKGAAGPRLVIAGHYDTKLFRDFAFVGANDGGSSAALLIELARVLEAGRRAMPIELVFFDGEEAVIEWVGNDHTYGSRHYVAEAARSGTLENIRAMILVDMIGDRDLRILRDTNSTPWLAEIVWDAARRLGRREFVEEPLDIQDDHIPFLQAGVPALDIIDLDYPAWHTEADTIDKVSAQSLQVVGDVLLAALPDIIARVNK